MVGDGDMISLFERVYLAWVIVGCLGRVYLGMVLFEDKYIGRWLIRVYLAIVFLEDYHFVVVGCLLLTDG